MAGEQEEAVRTSSQFEIRLVDGEELYGSVDGEEKSARGELAALHERLVDETFVALGDVLVRSEDVRWVRLKSEDSSKGGLLRNLLTGGDDDVATRQDQPTWSMASSRGAGQSRSRTSPPHWGETTPFMFTSEFIAYALTVLGVAITTAVFDNLDVWHGMLLITALTGGYVLARGLAKAGTPYREHEEIRSRWSDAGSDGDDL